MELRDLEYFLAIARHNNLTEAAVSLHLTQPALTRSLKHLEEELGKRLVIRGSRRIMLTEDGLLLERRAEEMLRLAEKTISEIRTPDDVIEGDIFVCAGETRGLHILTQAARRLMNRHPGVRLKISSGDTRYVVHELDNGTADFGLLFPFFDSPDYASIRVPFADRWGFVMRKDDPLAEKKQITAEEIAGQPLIVSRDLDSPARLSHLLNLPESKIHIAATYSLMFNGALMVTDGIGYLLGLEHILNLSGRTTSCFRPLYPTATEHVRVCWKKYAPMSRQAAALLEEMRNPASGHAQYLFDSTDLKDRAGAPSIRGNDPSISSVVKEEK